MPDVLKPRDHNEVVSAVLWALEQGKSLEIIGHGTKREIGRPAQTGAALALARLTGVTLYEPEELVLSAKAATPLAEITAMIEANGQELAFEPMDHGPLFGRERGLGTIGGAIAVNLSGPRRIKAGAARDHLLGALVVSGHGETFKTGGRVVKNVTGYDLCKLMAGSFGTLGVMTEVTLKVLPRAETEASLLAFGMDDRTATAAMAAGLGSPTGVSAAAHLPDYIAPRFDGLTEAQSTTVFRIEGVTASLGDCLDTLKRAVRPYGTFAVLEGARSQALWRAIRDVEPFWVGSECGQRPVWRISTAPSNGVDVVAKISPAAQLYYDWGGGLIWVAPPVTADCSASEIHAAVAAIGGHALLVRAPAAARAAVDVFPPETGALAALTRRVKQGFDPNGVLNPGRMWAGV